MAIDVKQPIGGQAPEVNRERQLGARAEQFWTRNSKFIFYGLAVILVATAGYFIYKNYFKAPEEKKAITAMWKAEQYFRMDSARLALNGDGANQGFLRIISKYGSTKAGNLAKFYAGSSYMKMGDFNNAIKWLKDFSTDDKMIQLRATGLLGDAYAESGKKELAVENYKKAGTLYEADNYNSPEYLFRAGLLYQDLGKNKEAIEMFRIIREKYSSSQRGTDIEKYLARLGDTK
jgi:TolA-binding protein